MSGSGIAYYLYCLAPSVHGFQPSAIGVDGQHPVLVRACGGIGAVFSEVELEEFCGDSAEAHLQDLAWLGPRACRHEAVIEEAMSRVPVLPARFATLFTSFDSMQQSVHEHREAITGFFAQLGDRQEWAVKGLLNRAGALGSPGSSGQPAPDGQALVTSPGTQYFRNKRISAQLERDFNLRLKEFCLKVAAVLGAQASGFRERGVSMPAAAQADAEVIFNWAFLLSPAALEEFRVRLDRFNSDAAFPGLSLALTGPWPPYSFVPHLSGDAKA